jgi:deazaflavin-dependent oxidoreductase (nitroreductase family)
VSDQYRAPGWFTRNVFNQLVAFLTRQGISVLGSRVLAVKGRTSGEWRTTPVNLLSHDGRRYLIAPRGETQWVRNLRAAGTGELRLGKHAETFRGRELTDDEKVPVLRAYLKRWKAEVGIFFEGTGPDSSDDQIRAIAPKHPAFEVDQPLQVQPGAGVLPRRGWAARIFPHLARCLPPGGIACWPEGWERFANLLG